MAQGTFVLEAGGPVNDERCGDAAFMGVTFVHAERGVAEVGPAAAGAGGPTPASAPLGVVVHAGLGMPTVLGEEPTPIMHAGAGHAVVHHEQE